MYLERIASMCTKGFLDSLLDLCMKVITADWARIMGHTVFDPRILMYFLLFFIHSYLSHQDAFFLFVPQMIF